MYLLGIDLPDEKNVWVSLTKIYGVGFQTGKTICDKLSISHHTKLSSLTELKVIELSQLLNTMTIEAELKRKVRDYYE